MRKPPIFLFVGCTTGHFPPPSAVRPPPSGVRRPGARLIVTDRGVRWVPGDRVAWKT